MKKLTNVFLDNLLILEKECQKWEVEVASGDVNKRLDPHSSLRLNQNASWPVGPKCRSKEEAMRNAQFINILIANSKDLLEELKCSRTEIESLKYQLKVIEQGCY